MPPTIVPVHQDDALKGGAAFVGEPLRHLEDPIGIVCQHGIHLLAPPGPEEASQQSDRKITRGQSSAIRVGRHGVPSDHGYVRILG